MDREQRLEARRKRDKAPSTITVNGKKYDKVYRGPHTKVEAYQRTKGFRKKGYRSKARKFGTGWYIYMGSKRR